MVHAEFLQARLQSVWDIGDVGDDFSGYEEFVAGYTGLRNCCSEL